jgi:hypothetical protein
MNIVLLKGLFTTKHAKSAKRRRQHDPVQNFVPFVVKIGLWLGGAVLFGGQIIPVFGSSHVVKP